MKKKTKVLLGSSKESNSPAGIPAFYLERPEKPTKTLLVSLNLPLDRVNQELDIFNRFISLWEEYAQESGYEFDYDKNLYEKTGDGWRVIED